MPSPDYCFTLFAVGLALVYFELLRPGLYLAGCLGAAFVSVSVFYFSRYSLSLVALGLIGSAALLFVIEASRESHFLAGGTGTVMLCLALNKLVAPPKAINVALAVPVCFCLGAVTTYLARTTRVARQNKSGRASTGEALI